MVEYQWYWMLITHMIAANVSRTPNNGKEAKATLRDFVVQPGSPVRSCRTESQRSV